MSQHYLYEKYGSSLNKEELAQELKISMSTINRALKSRRYHLLPGFKRSGDGEKSKYIFPTKKVIEFLEVE